MLLVLTEGWKLISPHEQCSELLYHRDVEGATICAFAIVPRLTLDHTQREIREILHEQQSIL